MRVKNQTHTTQTRRILVVGVLSAVVTMCVPLIFSCKAPEGEASTENAETDDSAVAKTQYCDLKYPEKWQSQMVIKETTEGDIVSENFYALLGNSEYALYTVHFGKSTKGELFGHISDVPVYIECHTLPKENTLTDDEKLTYYQMMESINEVTQSIAKANGYVRA
jgi:hypothetical protein